VFGTKNGRPIKYSEKKKNNKEIYNDETSFRIAYRRDIVTRRVQRFKKLIILVMLCNVTER